MEAKLCHFVEQNGMSGVTSARLFHKNSLKALKADLCQTVSQKAIKANPCQTAS